MFDIKNNFAKIQAPAVSDSDWQRWFLCAQKIQSAFIDILAITALRLLMSGKR